MTFVLTTTSDICSSFFSLFLYGGRFRKLKCAILNIRSLVLNRDYVTFSHGFRINLGINHVS